jgi:hypothetical protein
MIKKSEAINAASYQAANPLLYKSRPPLNDKARGVIRRWTNPTNSPAIIPYLLDNGASPVTNYISNIKSINLFSLLFAIDKFMLLLLLQNLL